MPRAVKTREGLAGDGPLGTDNDMDRTAGRGVARAAAVYRVFHVSFGWCAAARDSLGICAFVLPVPDMKVTAVLVRRHCPVARESRSALRPLVKAVRRYFDGWRTEFDDFGLNLACGTAFQQRVWALARQIPYGRVRTYRRLGMEMGRPDAVRAIGAALGANPTPLLVPCHRVVCADGTLGGFSAEGGLDLKAKLLELERVRMTGEGTARRVLVPGGVG